MQFAEAAKVAVVVERSLHTDFFNSFGVDADEFARTPMSPVCHHYSSFLIATAYASPIRWRGGAAALLLDLCRGRPGHSRPRGAAETL